MTDEARAVAVIDRAVSASLGVPMRWPDDWCASWTAAGVAAIWGVDLLGNQFGGPFAIDEAAALEAYPLGLAVMLARRLRLLGWHRVPIATAPPGAVVAIRAGGDYGHSVGLMRGQGWAVRRSANGVTYHPSGDVVAAWMPREVI